ncbi:MAG: tetratricopeptide repeat protein, partial [Pseudonocardiaceae bacterium]
GWYTHTARAAHHQVTSLSAPMAAVVVTPAHPHPLAGLDEAWVWLTTERANIMAVLQHAADHWLDHHTIPLANACGFLLSAGSLHEQVAATSLGITAARRTGNHTQGSWLLLTRGTVLGSLGTWDQAQEDLDRAETLIQHLDDAELQLWMLNDRGLFYLGQGQFAEAVRWLDQALPLSRGIDTGRWEAVVEGNLGEAHLGLGHHQLALEHGEHGLHLRQQIGDLVGEAAALAYVARAWRQLGDVEKAIALCQKAITIGRSIPRNRNATLARPLAVLAICLNQLGHTSEAATCWQQAADVYEDTGYPHKAAEIRQRLHDAQTPP